MFHAQVSQQPAEPKPTNVTTTSGKGDGTTRRQVQRDGDKVGRNAPCPCGSGKKYKHCHGQLA